MTSCILMMCCGTMGCQLLFPEAPPLEDPILRPDDYAWDELDIAREYTYIHVPRIDCNSMQSAIDSTGRCLPEKRPYGSVIVCPLATPAKSLEIGCLDNEQVPDVMVRMVFEETASGIDFSELGPCTMVSAGPAGDQKMRYRTDIGYKACLFEKTTPPGQLAGAAGSERPVGIYLDFSNNPKSMSELNLQAQTLKFDAPVTLILDTRFLDENTRTAAFDHIHRIFDLYRKFPPSTPQQL